jgi:hypothetical protein
MRARREVPVDDLRAREVEGQTVDERHVVADEVRHRREKVADLNHPSIGWFVFPNIAMQTPATTAACPRWKVSDSHKRGSGLSIDVQTRGLTMTATMTATVEPATVEPATVEPAAAEPAAVEFATVEPTTMEFAAMESVTVEPITMEFAAMESVTVEPITMESAEAFAAESAIAEVRGIAVASVIPPSVGTSRQAEGRNQKRAKDN